MTTILIIAADLLEENAKALFESHTIDGKWVETDEADSDAKDHHAELIDIASELRHLQQCIDCGRTTE